MIYAPETARIATPIGIILIQGSSDSIDRIRILAGDDGNDDASRSTTATPAVAEAIMQIGAYFAGRLTRFDLPLAAALSPRGLALRNAIIDIPFGKTLTYGELARIAGSAPRAIGQACARNPFPIVIPCHRVLAQGDRLGAYSAGDGPATKRWLLDHEMPDPQQRMFQ